MFKSLRSCMIANCRIRNPEKSLLACSNCSAVGALAGLLCSVTDSSDEAFLDGRKEKTAANCKCPFGSPEDRNVVLLPLSEELLSSPGIEGVSGFSLSFSLVTWRKALNSFCLLSQDCRVSTNLTHSFHCFLSIFILS